MLDHQLSCLSAYFQGKLNSLGSVWGGFLIAATEGIDLTETENAQKTKHLISFGSKKFGPRIFLNQFSR